MKILLGVSSSIAVYKALDLCSALRKRGHEIKVILTKNAKKMVSEIPFHSLSSNIVYHDEFGLKDYIPHISLSDWADILLIVPATANIIGKMANGIADDLLSTSFMAFNKKVVVAPAMNVKMYNNPILQKNLNTLREIGVSFIEPAEGLLACGYEGKGKLAPVDEILKAVEAFAVNEDNLPLKGKKVVVTAGGTIEDIDPVRYISNRSSGKMGIAFAKAASNLGADVHLIYGNISTNLPSHIKNTSIRSANELLSLLQSEMKNTDILVMAAAVADYRLEKISDKKLKKGNEENITLNLVKNPDILRTLSSDKTDKQVFVGFALETDDLMQNAQKKLEKKKLDLIIANSPSNFDSFDATVHLLFRDKKQESYSSLSKDELALTVFKNAILKILNDKV